MDDPDPSTKGTSGDPDHEIMGSSHKTMSQPRGIVYLDGLGRLCVVARFNDIL